MTCRICTQCHVHTSTLFRICALLLSLATAGPSPATQGSKLASSFPKHQARVGGGTEASRCWNVANNGSHSQLRFRNRWPDPPSDNTGVLKRVNLSALIQPSSGGR